MKKSKYEEFKFGICSIVYLFFDQIILCWKWFTKVVRKRTGGFDIPILIMRIILFTNPPSGDNDTTAALMDKMINNIGNIELLNIRENNSCIRKIFKLSLRWWFLRQFSLFEVLEEWSFYFTWDIKCKKCDFTGWCQHRWLCHPVTCSVTFTTGYIKNPALFLLQKSKPST